MVKPMLTNKQYKRFIKFDKTIEDLYDDSNSGLFQTFNDQSITHKPEFVRTSLFNLSRLDDMILGRYGERFLNKMGSQEYSVNSYDELIYPNDLKNLADEITSVYYRKWDNLLYLYSIQMGRDYNPIENYSSYEKTTYNDVTDERSHSGSDTDTHTFNDVTDEFTKAGTEKESQNATVKERPLKTATKISDEYGENGLNGIKDTKKYNRDYETVDTAGETGTPFTTTEEKQIAGMNSASYSNSEKITKEESGIRGSQAFKDGNNSGESTERTGKHSSLNESGGDYQNGAIVAGDLQTTQQLDAIDNYKQLSFTDRTDTNVKSGSEELKKEYDSSDTNVKSGNFEVEKKGNIGVMTASQMLESAWNGEMERNFLNVILKDVADFISLQCY